MRLVFVHGWGFDAALWDGVAEALGDIPQTRVEIGYLGAAPGLPQSAPDDVLVGHSLGFLFGLTMHEGWQSAIAINGFARFAGGAGEAVAPSALRAMRTSLQRNPQKTLANFYRSFGLETVPEIFAADKLAEGLEFLKTAELPPILPRILVLASRNDPLVPQQASAYLGEAAKADVIWHETGGHLLPLTDPEFCAAAIRAFLK